MKPSQPTALGAANLSAQADPRAGLHGAGELAHAVAASLAPGRVNPLAAALAASVRTAASYEASVRGAGHGGPYAGRMMIEQASPEVLDAIARTLGVALPNEAIRWRDRAGAEGVPLIAGWDVRGGGGQRCVKLYVNASDAARPIRARLCAELVPSVACGDDPAAVLGMNVRADGVIETKLYVQASDSLALAEGAGARAVALAEAARGEGADAGAVLSYDAVGGSRRARAFFVALREPPAAAEWRCVGALPGYDPAAIEALLPFPPAPPRSLGIALGEDGWTLYFKPRHSGRAPEALEPTAIFRHGDVEVGVFVEPTEQAARAFRRTRRHAVSVRVRAGTPAPPAIEALVDWFTARLRVAEGDAAPSGAVTDPPPPWRAVGDAQPLVAARGPA